MEKIKILGTGLNGLVGTRIVDLLGEKYEFENLSRSTGTDITNQEQITAKIAASPAPVVLHIAAKTDVDGCEKDKPNGRNGEAWKINVDATGFIAKACAVNNKKIIYVSTDFVFDGDTTPSGGYVEDSDAYPVNWYGETKYRGEEMVQDSGAQFVIVRLAYPYRAQFEQKKDFMRAMKDRLAAGQKVQGVVDHIMCPVLIDDVAAGLDVLIQKNAAGVFHVVGSEPISPYDAVREIALVFDYDTGLIEQTSRDDFFKERAQRPFNLTLNNDKIKSLNVVMRTFEEGLQETKAQMANIKDTN